MSATINWFYENAAIIHVPFANSTHKMRQNVFFNYERTEATGLERLGNFLLRPARYIFDGKTVTTIDPANYSYKQSFTYRNDSHSREILKTVFAVLSLPIVLALGGAIKGLSFASSKTRDAHKQLQQDVRAERVQPRNQEYQEAHIDQVFSEEFVSFGNIETPTLSPKQQQQIDAELAVAKALEEAKIPHWLSCGTLLGCYRHGKMIPWDNDVDMSIPALEHENAMRVLQNRLDSKKYLVQDWSGCRRPNSYIRVVIKESNTYLDIYTHKIDPKKGEIEFVSAFGESPFLPKSAKDRETAWEKPYPLSTVFPLKKATFHGVQVRVPADTEKFLQGIYGENLAPSKVWDPATNTYKKVEGHPYWETHEW